MNSRKNFFAKTQPKHNYQMFYSARPLPVIAFSENWRPLLKCPFYCTNIFPVQTFLPVLT